MYCIGPCFRHYRTFKGLLPSTGGKQLVDSVKFKHHAIEIQDLTPADRILEAARQLDIAIKQQPKRAHMNEITTIEILREVRTVSLKDKIPPNSVQIAKQNQKAATKANPVVAKPPQPTRATTPEPQSNYVVDSKDEDDSEDDEAIVP